MNDSTNALAVGFRPFGLTIGFWTLIVGTTGNTLTILAFFLNKKLQTTFNIFLVNLAMIDFCSSFLMLPFHLVGYIMMEWPFGNDSFTARLQAFNYFCCGYSSIVFLLLITVNRLQAVLFPMKKEIWFSRTRMIWLLLFGNLVAPALLLPFLIATNDACPGPSHGLTGFHPGQFLSTFICKAPGWDPYVLVIRVLFQFLPLVMMISIYTIIFVYVNNKHKRLNKTMSKNISDYSTPTRSILSDKSNSISTKRNDVHAKRKRDDKRLLMISVAICVGFMFTFLPSVILNLIPGNRYFDVRWHMAASNLAWFNSSLNPIIYIVLNRKFRCEYLRLLRMAAGKGRRTLVNGSTGNPITKITSDKQTRSHNVT